MRVVLRFNSAVRNALCFQNQGPRPLPPVAKAEFSREIGVNRSAVGNIIRRQQISGEALVTVGGRVMIEADIARAQLRQRLDVRQRIANGRARLDGAARLDGDAAAAPMADDPVMASIKSARLRQIELANAKAEAEAVERAGRFVSAADAKQEMGAIAGRMVSAFEGALTELAERSPTPGRCIGTPCSPYAERGGPSGHAWQARPRPQGTRNLPRPSLGRRCRSSRPRLAGHRFGLQIRAARGLSGLGEGQRRFRGRRAGAWPIQSGRLPSFLKSSRRWGRMTLAGT